MDRGTSMKISIKKTKYKKESLHDNLAVMSYAEAEKMLRIQGCPTTEHILDKAKSKVNWPDEVWEQAEAIINANKQNKGKPAARKNQHGYHRPLYRRGLALTCGFVVLLTGFILFAPAGRAFALQVRQAIIRLFDNRATVEIAEPDYAARTYDQSIAEKYASALDETTNSETSSESSPQEFSCIEDFIKETGYVPYVLDANDYSIESISYSSSPHYGNSLIIQYKSSMGGILVSTQIWDLSTDITTFSDDGFQHYLAQRGNIIYYSIDKTDKSFYGVTVLEDSVLYIGADRSIPLESILALF